MKQNISTKAALSATIAFIITLLFLCFHLNAARAAEKQYPIRRSVIQAANNIEYPAIVFTKFAY